MLLGQWEQKVEKINIIKCIRPKNSSNFCSGRLVGERLVEVEVRGLRFYTRVQIWIIIGGWVLRKGGLRIEGGSMLQL